MNHPPEPNWGNTHEGDCDVTKHRDQLWEQLCRDISKSGFTYGGLWGSIIEYTAGGDQEVEACNCSVHAKPTPEPTILAIQARALAEHIQAFNQLVIQDTNTHDGEPRGFDWTETVSPLQNLISAPILDDWNRLLCDLAELWDNG